MLHKYASPGYQTYNEEGAESLRNLVGHPSDSGWEEQIFFFLESVGPWTEGQWLRLVWLVKQVKVSWLIQRKCIDFCTLQLWDKDILASSHLLIHLKKLSYLTGFFERILQIYLASTCVWCKNLHISTKKTILQLFDRTLHTCSEIIILYCGIAIPHLTRSRDFLYQIEITGSSHVTKYPLLKDNNNTVSVSKWLHVCLGAARASHIQLKCTASCMC